MNYYDLFEIIVWTSLMAAFIYVSIKWISAQPKFLQEINPKTNESGPPHICRGEWSEGIIRGCSHGYEETGIPVEPVNTYSNLAYLIAGLVAYKITGGYVAIIFLISMAFLCFGSALYHGFKTRWSGRWDHGGIYAVLGVLAFYLMVHCHKFETWFVLGGAILSGGVLAFILDRQLMERVGILLTLITAGVITKGNWGLCLISLGLFLLAFVIWKIDKKSRVLDRYGHGLWHIFTAAAFAVMFIAI